MGDCLGAIFEWELKFGNTTRLAKFWLRHSEREMWYIQQAVMYIPEREKLWKRRFSKGVYFGKSNRLAKYPAMALWEGDEIYITQAVVYISERRALWTKALLIRQDMSTTCREHYDPDRSMLELVFCPCGKMDRAVRRGHPCCNHARAWAAVPWWVISSKLTFYSTTTVTLDPS